MIHYIRTLSAPAVTHLSWIGKYQIPDWMMSHLTVLRGLVAELDSKRKVLFILMLFVSLLS
jgi:hypothetical protein